MFHYIRDTRRVTSTSGLAVSVNTCRRMSTKAGYAGITFVVILSSAGSIMRSRRCLFHGKQTVSYFLLQDCKELTYNRRGSRRGRIRESETLIVTVFD